MAAPAVPRQGQREGPGERLAEFVVLAGMAGVAVASVLPLVLVAIPVFLTLCALRTRSWRWKGPALLLCLLPALAAVLVAAGTRGVAPVDVAMGYVDVQLAAGAGGVRAVRDGAPFDWAAYGLAVWPYALAGGAALGAGVASVRFVSTAIPGGAEEHTELKIRDAAQLRDEPVAWGVENVVGRNVISLLSAPPGGGKGWWTWGLARAMQDGHAFFGLPATRMKLLWLTEEGASFARTRERFGVEPGLVEVIHRHEVRGWAWPELVTELRRQAWRRKCGLVVVDTIRAWCPEAESTPEDANRIMTQVRQELTGHGLGVLFVHHTRKGGGEHGEGVSGTYGLVGAVDVLIELKRVGDDPADTRRRMVTSRRFEPLDRTATLEGHRYVLLPGQGQKAAARAAVQEAVHQGALTPATAQPCARCGRPAAEWHHASYAPGAELAVEALCRACHRPETADPAATLRQTVKTIVDAGGAMTTPAFAAAIGIKDAAASKRLNDAEAAGLLRPEGKGGRSGPRVWRAL